MSDNGKRRKWGAAGQRRIVLAGMQPGVVVSDLGRRQGLNPVLFYAWKKQLRGAARRIFEAPRRPSAQEQRREAELRRLKAVSAAITAANLELPTGLWASRTRARAARAAAAGRRRGRAGQDAARLAGSADAGRLGRAPQQLLPLAPGGGRGVRDRPQPPPTPVAPPRPSPRRSRR